MAIIITKVFDRISTSPTMRRSKSLCVAASHVGILQPPLRFDAFVEITASKVRKMTDPKSTVQERELFRKYDCRENMKASQGMIEYFVA